MYWGWILQGTVYRNETCWKTSMMPYPTAERSFREIRRDGEPGMGNVDRAGSPIFLWGHGWLSENVVSFVPLDLWML